MSIKQNVDLSLIERLMVYPVQTKQLVRLTMGGKQSLIMGTTVNVAGLKPLIKSLFNHKIHRTTSQFVLSTTFAENGSQFCNDNTCKSMHIYNVMSMASPWIAHQNQTNETGKHFNTLTLHVCKSQGSIKHAKPNQHKQKKHKQTNKLTNRQKKRKQVVLPSFAPIKQT